MNVNRHTNSSVFQPLAGWVGLLLYVGLCSPFGIGLALAAGLLDRDHQVELLTGTHEMRVVLHHQSGGVAHHHGLLAQTLIVFSGPVSSVQADHVLPFRATDSVSDVSQCKSVAASGEESPIQQRPEFEAFAALKPPRIAASYPPPPVDDVARRCRRSTVLLI